MEQKGSLQVSLASTQLIFGYWEGTGLRTFNTIQSQKHKENFSLVGVRVRVCERKQGEFADSTAKHGGGMGWVTAASNRQPD